VAACELQTCKCIIYLFIYLFIHLLLLYYYLRSDGATLQTVQGWRSISVAALSVGLEFTGRLSAWCAPKEF